MTNLMQDGANWLAGQLQQHAGESVTYRRGSENVTITATRVSQTYNVMDANGFPVVVKSLDWTIETALLVISSVAIEPRPGDRIEDASGEVHDVLPMGKEPCFTPLDANKTMLTVHSDIVILPS